MSIIAIHGLPTKFSLGDVVKALARAINGHFEALNFKTPKWAKGGAKPKQKTCYIRLSEKLDPVRIVEKVNDYAKKFNKRYIAAIPETVPDVSQNRASFNTQTGSLTGNRNVQPDKCTSPPNVELAQQEIKEGHISDTTVYHVFSTMPYSGVEESHSEFDNTVSRGTSEMENQSVSKAPHVYNHFNQAWAMPSENTNFATSSSTTESQVVIDGNTKKERAWERAQQEPTTTADAEVAKAADTIEADSKPCTPAHMQAERSSKPNDQSQGAIAQSANRSTEHSVQNENLLSNRANFIATSHATVSQVATTEDKVKFTKKQRIQMRKALNNLALSTDAEVVRAAKVVKTAMCVPDSIQPQTVNNAVKNTKKERQLQRKALQKLTASTVGQVVDSNATTAYDFSSLDLLKSQAKELLTYQPYDQYQCQAPTLLTNQFISQGVIDKNIIKAAKKERRRQRRALQKLARKAVGEVAKVAVDTKGAACAPCSLDLLQAQVAKPLSCQPSEQFQCAAMLAPTPPTDQTISQVEIDKNATKAAKKKRRRQRRAVQKLAANAVGELAEVAVDTKATACAPCSLDSLHTQGGEPCQLSDQSQGAATVAPNVPTDHIISQAEIAKKATKAAKKERWRQRRALQKLAEKAVGEVPKVAADTEAASCAPYSLDLLYTQGEEPLSCQPSEQSQCAAASNFSTDHVISQAEIEAKAAFDSTDCEPRSLDSLPIKVEVSPSCQPSNQIQYAATSNLSTDHVMSQAEIVAKAATDSTDCEPCSLGSLPIKVEVSPSCQSSDQSEAATSQAPTLPAGHFDWNWNLLSTKINRNKIPYDDSGRIIKTENEGKLFCEPCDLSESNTILESGSVTSFIGYFNQSWDLPSVKVMRNQSGIESNSGRIFKNEKEGVPLYEPLDIVQGTASTVPSYNHFDKAWNPSIAKNYKSYKARMPANKHDARFNRGNARRRYYCNLRKRSRLAAETKTQAADGTTSTSTAEGETLTEEQIDEIWEQIEDDVGFVSSDDQIPLGAKPKGIPLKLRMRLRIPDQDSYHQVLKLASDEILTELQAKYPGLQSLYKSTDFRLPDELRQKIFTRVEALAQKTKSQEPVDNCYKMTKDYRRAHPHFGDFQFVLSTLHAIQDSTGVPRSQLQESDLSAAAAVPHELDMPRKKITQLCTQYTEKIVKRMTEHIMGLQSDISATDTEEEIARKQVREELKKLNPFLPEVVNLVVQKHFLQKDGPYYRVRIYGEPFLPNKETMRPFLARYKPTQVLRSTRMFNMIRFNVPPAFFHSLMAMNGTVLNGAKLMICSSDVARYNKKHAPLGGDDDDDDDDDDDEMQEEQKEDWTELPADML